MISGHIKLLLISLFIMILSCSSSKEQKEPPVLQWPLDSPRIRYHSSLMSELDVIEKKDSLQTIAGVEKRPESLLKPYGVATDHADRIYVSDVGRIFVFDRQAKRLTLFEDSARLKRPLGMFYDRKDRLLYVADGESSRVFVFNEQGRIVLEIGNNGELLRPGGVVVDSIRNRVYVTNTGHHRITVFDTAGHLIEHIGKRGFDKGEFNFPTQIAIDSEGNLYVVDTGNFRIQILSPEGRYIRHIGSHGTAYGQFGRPRGIALDADGNIYVTDALFHGVTIFNNEGRCLLVWGKRGWKPGQFELPAGIHIDQKGFIYIVSQGNARVDLFEILKEYKQ